VDDLVFLVTGSACGIGEALVSRLAAAGLRVVAADLDNHRLEETARRAAWPLSQVRLVPLDIRRPAHWETAFAAGARAFGGVDVLVHAARSPAVPAGCGQERQRNTAAEGTACGLQAAAAHMVPRGRGQVVVLSSLDALAPHPCHEPLAAAAAVRALALAADQELRPRGVAVTTICAAADCSPGPAAADDADVRLAEVILGRALSRRPRELLLPAGHGVLARLVAFAPALIARLWCRRELRRGRPPGAVRAHEA
jgi:NADP-dependent 3-hydroxy acid dehydrogenase YdfG